jgi:hypothetical protein
LRQPWIWPTELEGVDHWPTVGAIKSITGEIEEFLTGQRQEHLPDRVPATVLFTDIVDSTRHAARLGDHSWRELLARHDEVTHTEIGRFQGRVVQHTCDGFLAAFDGPTRALRCATTVAERMPELGIDVRCGLHTSSTILASRSKSVAPTCSRAYPGNGSCSRRQATWRPSITTCRSNQGDFKRSWQIASAADHESPGPCCGRPTGAEITRVPSARKPRSHR